MNIRRGLTSAAFAISLALAALVVTAGPADAAVCELHGRICGTVVNHTGHSVKVCTTWTGKNAAFTWSSQSCASGDRDYVRPYTTWGGHGVDLDALSIPPGGWLAIHLNCRGLHNRHDSFVLRPPAGQKWWKFPSDCIVHVDNVIT